MKKMIVLLLGLSLMLVLAACGGTAAETGAEVEPVDDVVVVADTAVVAVAEEAVVEDVVVETAVPIETSEETVNATLTENYAEDALPIRTQLILGTMKLEDTDLAVTPKQAAEEVTAVLNQIQDAMTPAQISAIAAMQLTNGMLQTFYVETGISEAQTPEPGVTPQSMKMSDLPQEAREATREASGMEPGGGGSGKSDALLEMTLELLAGKQ